MTEREKEKRNGSQKRKINQQTDLASVSSEYITAVPTTKYGFGSKPSLQEIMDVAIS